MRSASRCSEPFAMGRSSAAAVAARRSGSEASSETGAGGVSAISPSISTMSGPRSGAESGRVSGAPRRKRRFGGGVGSHSRRRRQTSSLTQAIWRPAVETASMSSSASEKPSADAT